jgi:hypothetical protein
MVTSTNPTWRIMGPRLMRDLMRDYSPLADFQAAGVAANFGGESRGWTLAQEIGQTPPRGGWGPAQWTGPRRRDYEKWLSDHGKNPHSPTDALDYDMAYSFFRYELEHSQKPFKVMDHVRAAKNLAGATAAFMMAFERPKVANTSGRTPWGQSALDAYRLE